MKTSTLTLLDDRVAVRRDDSEKETPGGIVLPESSKEKSMFARVIAVGPGAYAPTSLCDRREMQVQEGDRVLLDKWAGTETEIEGEKVLIIRESEILAVVE